jgi:23S rRNA (cytosine1962-C5)-methyltransferase
MNSLPTVLLKPGEADRILAGHPWIYEGAVLRVTAEVTDGAVVQVKDHRQRFLGVGFWNSKSKIRVRVLSPERVEINERFLRIGFAPRSLCGTSIFPTPLLFES